MNFSYPKIGEEERGNVTKVDKERIPLWQSLD
jgi:hypothetical protein